jgi:hypothetical protein
MNLNNRIERLENRLIPDYHRVHVIHPKGAETGLEARKRYCEENGLDFEKLEKGEYGRVFQRVLVDPDGTKRGA